MIKYLQCNLISLDHPMLFLQPFSENPKDRITGRTIRSIHMLGDISDKEVLNIGSLGGWFEDHVMQQGGYKKITGVDLP